MSSASPEEEAARARAAYARRARLGLDDRYAYWEPANLLIYQSRERALLSALRQAKLLPLTGRRILDAGCGNGAVLYDLPRYGATLEDLYGVDLLPERVEQARRLLPGAHVDVGDVQALSYEDASFDLVLAFTLLSSVLDEGARRRVVAELLRVVKPGGLVLVYDFRINPLNRDVKALPREQLRSLFPGHRVRFVGTTLAPPLARLLVRAPGGRLAASLLEVIPFLQTHYIASIST